MINFGKNQKEKPLFEEKWQTLCCFLFLWSSQENQRGDGYDSHQRQSDVLRRDLETEVLLQVVADERSRELCFGVVLHTKRVFQCDERTAQKNQLRGDGTRQHNCVVPLVPLVLHRENDSPEKQGGPDPMEPEDEVSKDAIDFHGSPPGFSFRMYYRATIARFLTVASIAYMSLLVKRNRKSLYYKAFSGFLYWIKKFSSPKMRNCEFVFTPKIEYKLVAERSEANQNSLTFPTWCPRQESNLELFLRTELLYPFNYEGKA